MTEASAPPLLHVLGGKHAPADLGAHLARIAELPEPARRSLWRVLGPSLEEPVTQEAERRLERFCRDHELAPAVLAEAVKAVRFLVRGAAHEDATKEQLDDDLAALGCSAPIRDLVCAHFDDAKRDVRLEILSGTLADHGKLCLGVDWRVDQMLASDRGEHLGAPVLHLTFRYREGDEKRRITLQLLPETLGSLMTICARFKV